MDLGKQSILEDSVEYFLFPKIGDIFVESEVREYLEKKRDFYLAQLSKHLVGYIWQQDSFNLQINVSENPNITPHYLRGITRYGDNVEDEWFIVYLLKELTKLDPDVMIRIADNGEELLLIEAANFIPKWLNPETATNRVFLHQGEVLCLPKDVKGEVTVTQALERLRKNPQNCRLDAKVNAAINERIKDYPDKIDRECKHVAHCYVPAAVAALLKLKPSLVSPAVRAFCLRDTKDTKACQMMKFFPPETRVVTDVLFTRFLYAQLSQQHYIPDRRVGWNIPSAQNSPNYKSHTLGMKLACGFEILVSNAKSKMNQNNFEDLEANKTWSQFLENLKKLGYFGDSLEGSKIYSQKLVAAKQHYSQFVRSGDEERTPDFDLLGLLDSLEYDIDDLRRAEKALQPSDSDSWMEVDPQSLDSMLEEVFKESYAKMNGSSGITDNLKTFMSHISSFEGAEMPLKNSEKKAAKRVSFDPEAFSDALQSVLDFKLPDWNDDNGSSSGMSAYGDEDEDDEEIDLNKSILADDPVMRKYMDQMDQELATSNIVNGSGENQSNKIDTSTTSVDDIDDDFKPVNVDLDSLQNILESYRSQHGLPGPVSNLLGAMNNPE